MKKTMLFLISSILLFAYPLHADTMTSLDGGELYQVFNSLFYQADDPYRMTNNTDLFTSGYYLADGSDLEFGNAGDTLRIDLTYRDSGWGGELGLWNGTNDAGDSGYRTLIEEGGIIDNEFTRQGVNFTVQDGYTFADSDIEHGRVQNRWSADSAINLLGEDHFVAFAIEDDSLLDIYNGILGTNYSTAKDDVWMVGFEEHSWDADFNDLVAVVSRPSELNAVPLPGAALMLFSGLAAVVGMRIHRSA